MAPNEKLAELSEAGVAVWLDDLSRDRIHSGDLQSLVDDDQVHATAVRKITAADVRDACDLLAPVAQRTGRDGRVSLEVAPRVARDTDATAAEAAHLWWLVDRPNLFIKIPATQEGLAAITTSIARGSASTSLSSSVPGGAGRSWTPTCPDWSSAWPMADR
jgi:transaldolase